MARKIVVTSGKGGVGKTTFTANLGFYLAKKNKKCVLIDMDLSLNNLDVVCGVENQIVYDIFDIALGRCRIGQALIETCEKNLFVLPSAGKASTETFEMLNFSGIVSYLDQTFDYIIFDCPAGIDDGFYRAIKFANEAVIVTTPHISAIRDASKVQNVLISNNIIDISLVVNRVRGDLILDGEMLSVKEIASLLGLEILGVIPESDNITSCLNLGKFVCGGDVEKAYQMCASKCINCKGEIFDPTEKYKGFFGMLKRKIKRV